MQKFIQDIGPKRALRGLIFGSPFSKGKITRLRAPSLPKGYFCVRAQDIPGAGVLSCSGYSLPVLSRSEVRYLGQPLLLFCGPDPDVLGEICSAVELAYEEQPPVEYKELSGPYREAQVIHLAKGEVELAFSLADQIFEGEYRSARQAHCYPDPQGALANWDGKILTLQAATQDPFGLRAALCRCLSLSTRKVRVVALPLGNTMEGKLLSSFLVAAQAALLSYKAGKPVLLIYDPEEDLLLTPKGPEFFIRHQTALDREARPLAVRVQIFMDGGCYPPKDCEALHQAVQSAWGAYSIANIEVTGRTLATDFPPIGSFRASGRAQAFLAAELHSSRLEEIAQLGPYNWKRENLSEAGKKEQRSRESRALIVLQEATQISGFTRKYSAYSALKKRRKTIEQAANPLRGIGLSFVDEQGLSPQIPEEARSSYAMKIVLERGRRIRIYTSLLDCAMGIHALFIQRAAELLDLNPGRIALQPVDTHLVPDTGPTTLSWAVTVGLPLLEQCCRALQEKRKISSPPIAVQRRVTLLRSAGVAGSERGGLTVKSKAAAGQGGGEPSRAATVVEVELDPVSLQSSCRGVWMVVEAGAVGNRRAAVRVLEGEILRALGSTRLPAYRQKTADRTAVCSSSDSIPSASELPEIQVYLLESEGAMKGFAQLAHLGVPPAYAAAVCQAAGLDIQQTPITAEVIQQCLQT